MTLLTFYNVIITPRKCLTNTDTRKQSCQRVHLSPRAKELTIIIIIGTSLIPPAITVCNKILFNYLLNHEDTIFRNYKDGFQTSKKCAQQKIYSYFIFFLKAELNNCSKLHFLISFKTIVLNCLTWKKPKERRESMPSTGSASLQIKKC